MTAKDIKHNVENLAEKGENHLRAVAEEASDTAERASDRIAARAEKAKDRIEESGKRLADAASDTVDDIADNPTLRRVKDSVTSGITDVADTLRPENLKSLAARGEAFARRNPIAFVAGAALAGFAIAHLSRRVSDRRS